jgi:hypothetical protein
VRRRRELLTADHLADMLAPDVGTGLAGKSRRAKTWGLDAHGCGRGSGACLASDWRCGVTDLSPCGEPAVHWRSMSRTRLITRFARWLCVTAVAGLGAGSVAAKGVVASSFAPNGTNGGTQVTSRARSRLMSTGLGLLHRDEWLVGRGSRFTHMRWAGLDIHASPGELVPVHSRQPAVPRAAVGLGQWRHGPCWHDCGVYRRLRAGLLQRLLLVDLR